MASSRFIVLNSYLFWPNRLLIVWCALNDKQKYHPNQQISASLIVNFFVLESGESSVLEVLDIALCSNRTLKYAVPIWKNRATCTCSCFTSSDDGFALHVDPLSPSLFCG